MILVHINGHVGLKTNRGLLTRAFLEFGYSLIVGTLLVSKILDSLFQAVKIVIIVNLHCKEVVEIEGKVRLLRIQSFGDSRSFDLFGIFSRCGNIVFIHSVNSSFL